MKAQILFRHEHFVVYSLIPSQEWVLIDFDVKPKRFERDVPYLHYPKKEVSIVYYPPGGGVQFKQEELIIYHVPALLKEDLKAIVLDYVGKQDKNFIVQLIFN